MMVRLRSRAGWIPIRQVHQPILLKLVKARRVRQGVNFSIFSSSVNERKGSADNHNGHPWGGERESAKKTGLRLPPPCRGLRDQFPSPGWGTGSLGDACERSASEPQRKRWCWRSDVVQHRPCRTIRGMLAHRLDREVDRQPHSSQEDIAMTSAVLVLALGLSGQSPQGVYPAAQGPGKVLPAAQAPGKVSPAPQAPAKVSPAPQAPSKIAPAPYAPSKVSPAPQAPSKIAPAPHAPSKVAADARRHRARLLRRLMPLPKFRRRRRPRAKIAPAPYAPAKVSPAPQAPAKIAPAPYAPAKVSPAPQAPAKYRSGSLCPGQGFAGSPGSGQGCADCLRLRRRFCPRRRLPPRSPRPDRGLPMARIALRKRRSRRQGSIDHKGDPPTGFAAIPSHDRVTHISLETDQAAAVSRETCRRRHFERGHHDWPSLTLTSTGWPSRTTVTRTVSPGRCFSTSVKSSSTVRTRL